MRKHKLVDGVPSVLVRGKYVPVIDHMREAINKAIFLADCDGAATMFDRFLIAPTNIAAAAVRAESSQTSNNYARDAIVHLGRVLDVLRRNHTFCFGKKCTCAIAQASRFIDAQQHP